MDDLYSLIFNKIFNECEPYLIHDFLNIRNTGNGNKNYCLFSYKKVFEKTIQVLSKDKYNGEIVIPNNIIFDSRHIYQTEEIIKTSDSYIKNKIVVNSNSVIKLANARETSEKNRIFLIPIDGIKSFADGSSDFAVVLALLQSDNDDDNVFKIKNISIFNPVRKDIFTFNETDTCKYNNKKIAFDTVYSDSYIDTVFVKNPMQKISFDLTKIAQISENLFISNSIFSSLVELLTTGKNLCISKLDANIVPYIEYAAKKSLLTIKQVGQHVVLGKDNIVKKIVEK